MHLGDRGKLVIENMQSSFDQRCQRTKQIVTELAQRLHEVKRDTFTELDRIQTRQSVRGGGDSQHLMSTSNSNSRSPKPHGTAINTLHINKKAVLDSGNHSRKASKDMTNNGLPSSFNQSGVSL